MAGEIQIIHDKAGSLERHSAREIELNLRARFASMVEGKNILAALKTKIQRPQA